MTSNRDKFHRTILIWYLKDLTNTKDRKTFRINVEYDFGYKLKWSPDGKAILIFKSMENTIEVYKFDKKDGIFVNPQKALTFPKLHEDDVIGFGISFNGRFIMSCTNQTELVLWDVRGNVLDRLDTFLMSTHCAKISPCGRFVGASGFAPDLKLWEVKFAKTGEYEKTVRAFELTGHNSGIWDFAFDQDTSHVATICKDGTFKVFNINIDYVRGESPRCILSGKYEAKGVAPLIALSLSAHTIAIAVGNSIYFYSGLTGELDLAIKHIFNDNITAMEFDPLGKQLFVAGDRQIRVFHNITGYKVDVEIAQTKLKQTQTTATRDRLEDMIDEYEKIIAEHSAADN